MGSAAQVFDVFRDVWPVLRAGVDLLVKYAVG